MGVVGYFGVTVSVGVLVVLLGLEVLALLVLDVAILIQGGPDGFSLDMMSTPAFQTTFDLVAQQLADIGIEVKYTDPGTGNFITDMLAPKYAATWMALEQNPDWQLINFMIAPNATYEAARSEMDPPARVGGWPGMPVSAMRPLMPCTMPPVAASS